MSLEDIANSEQEEFPLWKDVWKTSDPVEHYNRFHTHSDRGELLRRDKGLYRKLRREGKLSIVPKTDRRDFGGNPLAYCQKHHPGITRGKLAEIDPSLYQVLRKNGLISDLPRTKRDFGDDPVAFYRKYHGDLSRGELHYQQSGLYTRIRLDGRLDEVPLRHPLLQEYDKKHSGLSADKLKEENPFLHFRLKDKDLLRKLPQ